MDRFIESGGAGSAPSTPASAAADYPTEGNPLTATPASKPGEWWFHMITESLRAVIVAAGNTPLYSNLNLLKDSIVALVTSTMEATVRGTSLGVKTLSSSSEWTSIPSGVERLEIYVRGLSFSGSDDCAIQLGGSSYVTSGYAGQVREDSAGQNTWSTQALLTRGLSAAMTHAIRIILSKEPSTNIWHISAIANRDDGTGKNVCIAIGSIDVATTLLKIKLKASASDTFDGGTAFAKYW